MPEREQFREVNLLVGADGLAAEEFNNGTVQRGDASVRVARDQQVAHVVEDRVLKLAVVTDLVEGDADIGDVSGGTVHPQWSPIPVDDNATPTLEGT